MNGVIFRSILILLLILCSQQYTLACAGGGYTQVFPIAKNQNNQLWILHVGLGRDGEGYSCSYETELRLYNNEYILIDSLEVSKGERNEEIGTQEMPLSQFDAVLDSLYTLAVQRLKSKHYNLVFFTFNGAVLNKSDTLGGLQILRKQVVETYLDTSIYIEKDTVTVVQDTSMWCESFSYNGKRYKVDGIPKILSASGDFIGWPWQRIAIHGAKFYSFGNEKYVVLHFELMFAYQDWSLDTQPINQSTALWHKKLYHPIGWHHDGQEILIRLE